MCRPSTGLGESLLRARHVRACAEGRAACVYWQEWSGKWLSRRQLKELSLVGANDR